MFSWWGPQKNLNATLKGIYGLMERFIISLTFKPRCLDGIGFIWGLLGWAYYKPQVTKHALYEWEEVSPLLS